MKKALLTTAMSLIFISQSQASTANGFGIIGVGDSRNDYIQNTPYKAPSRLISEEKVKEIIITKNIEIERLKNLMIGLKQRAQEVIEISSITSSNAENLLVNLEIERKKVEKLKEVHKFTNGTYQKKIDNMAQELEANIKTFDLHKKEIAEHKKKIEDADKKNAELIKNLHDKKNKESLSQYEIIDNLKEQIELQNKKGLLLEKQNKTLKNKIKTQGELIGKQKIEIEKATSKKEDQIKKTLEEQGKNNKLIKKVKEKDKVIETKDATNEKLKTDVLKAQNSIIEKEAIIEDLNEKAEAQKQVVKEIKKSKVTEVKKPSQIKKIEVLDTIKDKVKEKDNTQKANQKETEVEAEVKIIIEKTEKTEKGDWVTITTANIDDGLVTPTGNKFDEETEKGDWVTITTANIDDDFVTPFGNEFNEEMKALFREFRNGTYKIKQEQRYQDFLENQKEI